MIQEIITYLIIGTTVIIIVLKFRKLFKKKTAGTPQCPMSTGDCANCNAECQIRDFSEMKPRWPAQQTEKNTLEKGRRVTSVIFLPNKKKSGQKK